MHLLVLVTHITNGGKVSAMLHKGAGDGSNSQLILIMKWPRYYMFFNNSQAKKKFQSEFGSIRGINHSHYKLGARLARSNIYRHTNHGYNSQMILKWHR